MEKFKYFLAKLGCVVGITSLSFYIISAILYCFVNAENNVVRIVLVLAIVIIGWSIWATSYLQKRNV